MDNRTEFIEKNIPLVHSLCKRFIGRGIEYDDLFQAGCMGLVKAYDGFDKSRGLAFSTYAVPVIFGELKRLFRDGGLVKVSRGLKELSLKAVREKENLSKQLGREPTVSEIAKHLEKTPEEITEALCAVQPAMSLTLNSDEESREYDLPDKRQTDSVFNRIALSSALDTLPERDRKLIELRYFGAKTQCETARELGMSQVQVSRREKTILLQMRGLLA